MKEVWILTLFLWIAIITFASLNKFTDIYETDNKFMVLTAWLTYFKLFISLIKYLP